MALYAVRHKASGKIRLVDGAPTNSSALRHVAGDEYDVTIPKPREVARLVSKGAHVEDYGKPVCSRCHSPEVVTNLDGDDLCQDHATAWVKAEGQAAAEDEAQAAAEQGQGDD